MCFCPGCPPVVPLCGLDTAAQAGTLPLRTQEGRAKPFDATRARTQPDRRAGRQSVRAAPLIELTVLRSLLRSVCSRRQSLDLATALAATLLTKPSVAKRI